METFIAEPERFSVNGSYPTYEEWKLYKNSQKYRHKIRVLILPMRNGNFSITPAATIPSKSSYPTYEEWKP